MIISQMLKGKRKEFQLTQEQLAEKIFVSTKTISNWETGKTKPDIESLILLAKLFDLSLDNLLLEGSDMVKSIDKDIRKGRNLKKIVFIAAFPMMAIIIILLWVNYKGNNMTIVPLNELSNIELSTSDLTNTTNIEADIKLKQFESYHFVDTIIEDNTVYLMVYKRPKLFSSSSHFSISLTESIEKYHLSTKDINKIVVTYLDVKKSNGFTREELVNDLPKKVVWERNNSQLDY